MHSDGHIYTAMELGYCLYITLASVYAECHPSFHFAVNRINPSMFAHFFGPRDLIPSIRSFTSSFALNACKPGFAGHICQGRQCEPSYNVL